MCCADSQSLPPGGGHELDPSENAHPHRDKTRADPLLIPRSRFGLPMGKVLFMRRLAPGAATRVGGTSATTVRLQ